MAASCRCACAACGRGRAHGGNRLITLDAPPPWAQPFRRRDHLGAQVTVPARRAQWPHSARADFDRARRGVEAPPRVPRAVPAPPAASRTAAASAALNLRAAGWVTAAALGLVRDGPERARYLRLPALHLGQTAPPPPGACLRRAHGGLCLLQLRAHIRGQLRHHLTGAHALSTVRQTAPRLLGRNRRLLRTEHRPVAAIVACQPRPGFRGHQPGSTGAAAARPQRAGRQRQDHPHGAAPAGSSLGIAHASLPRHDVFATMARPHAKAAPPGAGLAVKPPQNRKRMRR